MRLYDLLVSFWVANTVVLSNRIRYTHWGDPGQNGPGCWAKRLHRADRWIRPPRPPDCGDAVQKLGLHHRGAST